jgi:sialic acid synthase SpsE
MSALPPSISISNRPIGPAYPVYFIADIAANHCGSLTKAKELIHACRESRADAVKMQNFAAETIVSDHGFRTLQNVASHQSRWKQSVFDVYKAASIPLEWTLELKELCQNLGLHYFTSPYSLEIVQAVAPHVCAFKMGSGDLTWHEEIAAMCATGKPVIMATGASSLDEVSDAMAVATSYDAPLLLMQCNTEYTAQPGESREKQLERFRHINLRVLATFAQQWPQIPLGLSDHTHGNTTVIGAVGLFQCCAVEKHFTLDNSLEGPDHAFSMTPGSWLSMVRSTESLLAALPPPGSGSPEDRFAITRSFADDPEALHLAIGDGIKRVEANESNTVVIQRRAVRTARELPSGHTLCKEDLIVLRPCPTDALPPHQIHLLIGRTLACNLPAGECVRPTDLL